MTKTVIHDESGKALFGNKDHLEVAQAMSFSAMIFEMLSEKVPTEAQLKIFDLILNLSIDHGPDAPSAAVTIAAAKKGRGFGEAVGEGIAQINDTHGGAIEPVMEVLFRLQGKGGRVKEIVKEFLEKDKKIPGLGHRLYKVKDPRTDLVFKTAAELRIGEEYIRLIKEIRDEFEKQSGKSLVINIDGAIAAILCGFGWSSKLGKAVFIIARTPGLCAHYINNKE